MSKRNKPSEREMLSVVMGLLNIQQSERSNDEDKLRASRSIDIINWCLGCPSSFAEVAKLCTVEHAKLSKINGDKWEEFMDKYADACESDSRESSESSALSE